MIRFAEQVSRAIRILRGNRDESARASHLVAKKGWFVNDESVLVSQAEREKCSQSTFSERKIMSTKTAFKRVALVAAAALAIGGITAVSANAAISLDSITAAGSATATSSATTGVATTVALTVSGIAGNAADSIVLSPTITSSPITSNGGAITFAATAGATNVNTAYAAGATVTATAAGRVTAYTTASFTPDVAGTYVIKLLEGGPNGAYVAWTITAVAPAAITAAGSTVYTAPGIVGSVTSVNAAAVVVGKSAAGALATITATEGNGAAVAPVAVALSASVSGPGSVSFASNGTGLGRSVTAGAAALANNVYVYSDGTAGVSTITLSAGTTVIGTATVTFFGAPTSLTVTANVPVIGASLTHTGTALDTLVVVEKDANGVSLPQGSLGVLTFTSDATSSVASSGFYDAGNTASACSSTTPCYGVNSGATAGVANITVADTTNSLTAAPVAVRVSGGVATSVVFTTDSPTYVAGQSGTLTITLSDAAGTLPAGTYTVFSGSVTSSSALTAVGATLPTTTVTVGNAGTFTDTFNAPLSDGTATVGATASASTITVTPVTFTVTSNSTDAAQAAVDAANEATDAANAATDAANAAADSADAATQAAQDAGDKADAALAAVTALSQQVTNVLAKIASISALLVRIIKKVKA